MAQGADPRSQLPLTPVVLHMLLALADGPTEVHKVQVAKTFLSQSTPAPGLFPTQHIPTRLAEARARHAGVLKEFGLAAE